MYGDFTYRDKELGIFFSSKFSITNILIPGKTFWTLVFVISDQIILVECYVHEEHIGSHMVPFNGIIWIKLGQNENMFILFYVSYIIFIFLL